MGTTIKSRGVVRRVKLVEVHYRQVHQEELDLFDEVHTSGVLGKHAHEESKHDPPSVGDLGLWNPA